MNPDTKTRRDREYELQIRVLENEELAKKAIREYREALRDESKRGKLSKAMKSRVLGAVTRYQTSLRELDQLQAGRQATEKLADA